MPRIEIERIDVEQEDLSYESSTEVFDRIAFAERVVALVRPPGMRVAICEGSTHVTVESGRQWGKAPGSRWAVVRVPLHASRKAIARAVLSLYPEATPSSSGNPYRDGSGRPWVLDVLVGALGT